MFSHNESIKKIEELNFFEKKYEEDEEEKLFFLDVMSFGKLLKIKDKHHFFSFVYWFSGK